MIHRLTVTFNNVIPETETDNYLQYDLFTTPSEIERRQQKRQRDQRLQKTMLAIRKKYGKNAILKGMNLEEGATAMERNQQIGGHKA